jgi:Bacteriophage clamp loader A subunit
MSKGFVNVLGEKREFEKEAVGFFGNWAKWSEDQKAKPRYDWRYENSITSGKKIEIDGDYSQWRTNNILSNYKDTILYANEMNCRYVVTDQMHYDYLFNIIRKSKRYNKPETKEEKKAREKQEHLVDLISRHYKYNAIRAKEALKILTEAQINDIRKKQEKGGMK